MRAYSKASARTRTHNKTSVRGATPTHNPPYPHLTAFSTHALPQYSANSALLWTQYFKLELLYVIKLRGRRLALGLEQQPHTPPAKGQDGDEKDEGEGAHPIELPALAEEEDDNNNTARVPLTVPELDPSDPRAQSVQAVLSGAVPRVVYAAAVAARPTDLALRLDCLATLDTLPGAEDGHFEPLAREMLDGIARDMGPEAGAWAGALHALRGGQGGGGGKKKKQPPTHKGKKRPRGEEAGGEGVAVVAAWATGLGGAEAACLAALEDGVSRAAPGSRRMWEYYVEGLTELLGAPDAVVAAALARAAGALGGGEGEGLSVEMFLQWAGACGDNGKARDVLKRAVAAHGDEPRLWAARLRLAAGMGGEDVRAVWARALSAVGGATAGVMGEAGQRRAVADMWLVYLGWLVGKVEGDGSDSGASDSDSSSEDEGAGASGAAVTPAVVERALESALAGTRGLGRVEVCGLWARWRGQRGLRRALRLVGGLALDDDKAEADAAVGALAELCLAMTADETDGEQQQQLQHEAAWDFYESALAVCGSHPAARPLWDAYEAAERAAGQHQRANGVRWRAKQALGEQAKA